MTKLPNGTVPTYTTPCISAVLDRHKETLTELEQLARAVAETDSIRNYHDKLIGIRMAYMSFAIEEGWDIKDIDGVLYCLNYMFHVTAAALEIGDRLKELEKIIAVDNMVQHLKSGNEK